MVLRLSHHCLRSHQIARLCVHREKCRGCTPGIPPMRGQRPDSRLILDAASGGELAELLGRFNAASMRWQGCTDQYIVSSGGCARAAAMAGHMHAGECPLVY